MIKKWLNNHIIQNAGWLMFGRVIELVANLIVGLLTARYLGPANYGLIGYAAAYAGFFYPLCALGIHSCLVNELLDDPNGEGEILGTSLLLRLIASICSSFIIITVVFFVDKGESVTMIVVGLTTIGIVFQSFEVFRYWFQSRMQSKVTALVSMVAYLATSAYRVVLLLTGKTVEWFAFGMAVDYICIALLFLVAYRKNKGTRLRVSFLRGKRILRISCHFILPSVMTAIYAQTDKVMLKHLIGEAEIGYYSTAVSLCNAWCFVLTAIIDAVYPEIAKAYGEDKKRFLLRNRQLYAIIFYISIAVSVLVLFLAGPIVRLLYGEAYLPTVAPLRVIIWYTAFSYLGLARNAWVVCENRQKYLIWVYMAAAVSNIILNFALIPAMGAVGAAIASLVAQVVTTMIAPFFIKGLRENAKMMLDAILLRGVFPKK